MLFMGEELGSTSPFWFFIDTSDRSFARSVDNGRRKEFSYLDWRGNHVAPSDERAFTESRIAWDELHSDHSQSILKEYRELISLRRKMNIGSGVKPVVRITRNLLIVTYPGTPIGNIQCVFNLSSSPVIYPRKRGSLLYSRNCLNSGEELSLQAFGVAVIQK
jgi:maltooligosyltrehalose trehalohydrolase